MPKSACDDCGSSDGVEVYDDHTFCFVCRTWHGTAGSDKGTTRKLDKQAPAHFMSGEVLDLPNRSLRAETLAKFRYHLTTLRSEPLHVANYYSPKGALVAQKIRKPNKDFYVIGDLGAAGLYGENLWESGGKRLVITEGELDAISYAQATGGTWPVVSVPTGAPSAAKAIKKSLEFVESFDEVIFMFDNDAPGREAAVECAALLRPGLAKIVALPLKDASDMLVQGRGDELRKSVYQAKSYRPDGIIEGKDISLEQMMKPTPPGLSLPYIQLSSKTRGIRKELWVLTAGSGIGKTTLAREIGAHLTTEHNQRVGWLMLEEGLQKSIQSLVAIHNDIPSTELMERPGLLSPEQWQASKEVIIDTAAFYDAWGSDDIDLIISKMRYLAVGCECDYIVLDHITIVVSGLDVDERKAIDMFMTKMRQLIEQTGVGVIAICHLKRNGNKASFNEGGQVSVTDLRGSAAVEQLSDVIVAAERDQQAEEDDNIVHFRLLKNRPTGNLKSAGHAAYNEDTGRLLHTDHDFKSADKQPDDQFKGSF